MKMNLLRTAALLGVFVSHATAADFTSTWNGTNGNWSDTTKWSTPGAPGTFPNNGSPSPTYDAVQSGGVLTVDVGGGITLQKFTMGQATLTLTNPLTLNEQLTLSAPAPANSNKVVTQTINGASTMNVTGPMSWSATFNASTNGTGISDIVGVNTAEINGRTMATDAINVTGGLTLIGGGIKSLNKRALNHGDGVNPSLASWTAGTLAISDAGVFANKAGATFDTNFNGSIDYRGGSGSTFVNEGTFTKSGGTGTTTVHDSIAFMNTGSVNVNSGTLALNGGGTQTGTFQVAGGATLQLQGNHSLNAGVSFTGAGTTLITGHTNNGNYITTANGTVTIASKLTVNAPSASNSTAVVTQTLNGAGIWNITGPMTWTAVFNASINGTGISNFDGSNTADINGRTMATDVINVTGGLTLDGGGIKQVNRRALNHGDGVNPSLASWTAGTLAITDAGVFRNKAGATFDTNFNGSMVYRGGTAGTFINEGVFTKSGGGGTTTVNGGVAFFNSGTVNASNGSIAFNGGYTQTAGALVLSGGSVSGTLAVQGGKIQGSGTLTGGVSASGGSVHIEPGIGTTTGLLAITGDLTLTSGSKLSFDIGGTTAGTQHDKVTEGGGTALNVNGVTLEVGLLNGYLPAIGDTFTVVDASGTTMSNSFANVANGERLAIAGTPYSCKVSYGGATNGDKVILSEFATTPTSLTLDDNQIVENALGDRTVGLLSATDPDTNETLTFSLPTGPMPGGGTYPADNSLFQITANQLQAKSSTTLDFETKTSYSIRVRVQNLRGGFLEQAFTIQVQDVPAPTALALSNSSIFENRPANTVVGAFTTTDPTPGATFTYALVSGTGSTHNADFNISGGDLRSSQVFNKESIFSARNIRVRVTNNGGETLEQTFGITVLDEGPSNLALSPASILEGRPIGTTVGNFSATVVPAGTNVTYAFISGTGSTHNAQFTIDGTALKTAVVPDFGAGATRSIRIRATGPATETEDQVFTITVIEAGPPTDIALSASSVAENQPVNTVVGTLSATDPDPEAVHTFTLVSGTGSTDNARFNLNGTSLRTSQSFDKEAPVVADRGPFSIRVRVTNGANEFYEEALAITVDDIPSPTDIALSANSVAENQPANTVVGTLNATDPDALATFTFALVDTATFPDNARFNLTGPDGSSLRTSQSFDKEDAVVADRGPFNIRVRVSSSTGEFYDETLTISVTDILAPTDIALSASGIPENQPVNTIVGTLSATDSNALATFTFALVDTATFPDNSRFNLTGLDGSSLRTSEMFDFEDAVVADRGPFSIRVRVSSSTGEFYEETLTITVTDQGPATLQLWPSFILEGRPISTAVGGLFVTSIVPAGTAVSTWELVAGAADNALFTLVGTTVKTAEVLDHETAATRTVRVKATDTNGESFTQDITVTVGDVAITDIRPNADNVLMNLPSGTPATILEAVIEPADPEATPTFTIVSATPNDAIRISPESGNLLVTTRPLTSPTQISVRVRAEYLGESYEDDVIINPISNPSSIQVQNPPGTNIASVDIGDVQIGSSTTRTVTIKNPGPGHVFNVSIRNPAVPNNDASAASTALASDNDLSPGETKTVTITFAPQAFGNRSSTIVFESDNASDASLSVTGRGIGQEISVQQPLGTELVDGATLDFGRQPFGVSFPARSFTVKNVGVATSLTSIAATITGPDAAFFALDTQGLATSLAEGVTSTFRVSFQPEMNTLRSYNATLSITSSDADENPFDIPLAGEGVSPLIIAQTAYAKASDTAAGDLFGCSVAVSGNTVVVGAYSEDGPPDASFRSSGSVYVFVRDPLTGAWSQQEKLRASNPGDVDSFGRSVAISDDTVVVGASGEGSSTTGINSTPNEAAIGAGAAYVFVRSGGVWSQQAYLKASQVTANDEFGTSVAVDGDTVVVGARGEDSSTTGINSTPNEAAIGAGAAYVFARSGGVWSQQAYLKAAQVTGGDQFGSSVAVSGDTVVVGAIGEDSSTTGINTTPDEGASAAGAAYVFVRDPVTSAWSQQAYLKAAQVTGGDSFGYSVAVDEDTVVVGAILEDSSTAGINSMPDEAALWAGAAYVFVRTGSVWSQQAYLKAAQVTGGDLFGYSVAVDEDTVVVGATEEDSNTTGINSTPNEAASTAGAAYVFVRTSGIWSQQAYLKASQVTGGDRFGNSVAVSGGTMVTGADFEDSSTTGINSTPNESADLAGAAYIFEVITPEVFVHDGSDTGSPKLADNQAQAVDYGPTPLKVPVTRSYTINNVRSLPLTVSSITVPTGYTVVNAPSPTTPIPAQGTAVFSVRLDASLSLGIKAGDVTITTDDATNPEFAFPIVGEVQLPAPGSLDPRFGNGGVVRVDFGLNDKAFDMVMQPDGRLVLGGESATDETSGGRFALAGLHPNGQPDKGFGTNGQVLTTVPELSNPGITGICLQGTNIVAAGNRRLTNGFQTTSAVPTFALIRYLPDGSLDSTFGTDGRVIDNNFVDSESTGNLTAIASGKLLLAGTQFKSSYGFRPYVRRFDQNGKPDAGFTTRGDGVLPLPGSFGGGIAVNKAGEIFAAEALLGSAITMWKIQPSGLGYVSVSFPAAELAGFPAGTSVSASASAVCLQADGRPVIAGRLFSFSTSDNKGFLTARATTAGTLEPDTTFNGTGVRFDKIESAASSEDAQSVAVQADGKIVVAGRVGGKFAVVRYEGNGTLDTAFGTGGKVLLDLGADGGAYKVLLDAAGDIYVAGHASNGTDQDFVVVKLIGSIAQVPAMLVRNGSTATSPIIANGQATAISYDSARVGGTTVSKSFRVENSGTAPLTINSVTVPTGFVFSSAASTPSIEAGGNGKVSVLMRTSTLGTFSGPVTILTNDPANSTFTFPVTGQVVPNNPPTFSGFLATTNQGEGVKISLTKLISKVSDANGDPVNVTAFSPISLNGASITFDGNESLTYDPPDAFFGTDQFSVTFSDGEAEIVGIVSVGVNQDPAFNPKNAPKLEPLPGGLAISFTGIPGKKYIIQRSTNLTTWTNIATATANSQGKVTFTDPAPPQPSAFYRITF